MIYLAFILTLLNSDCLILGNEYEAQTESCFNSCFDQLKVMQNDYSSCIEDMRNLADNCLTANYIVYNFTDNFVCKLQLDYIFTCN